jgi:hypothetical protein
MPNKQATWTVVMHRMHLSHTLARGMHIFVADISVPRVPHAISGA